MAFQSRANACYANTTYMGLYNTEMYVSVGGTDVTTSVIKSSFELSISRAPMSCRFSLRDTAVTPGQEVQVRDGGAAGRVMFAGRVIETSIGMTRGRDGTVVYDDVIADNAFLLDRFELVTANYDNRTVGSICTDILDNFTDGGWTGGEVSVDATAPLTLKFELVRVVDALTTLAEAGGGVLVIDELNRTVSILGSYDDGHTLTIDNSNTDVFDVRIHKSRSQSYNDLLAIGASDTLAQAVNPGDTEVIVSTINVFEVGSGSSRALLNGAILTYTDTESVGDGTLRLTGVTNTKAAGIVGDTITLLDYAQDPTDKTTFASTLGGGLSGQIQHAVRAPNFSERGTEELNQNLILAYSEELMRVSFRTRSRFVHPLKTVTVSLSEPRSISGSVKIDTVRITAQPGGKFAAATTNFEYEVLASVGHVPMPRFLELQS